MHTAVPLSSVCRFLLFSCFTDAVSYTAVWHIRALLRALHDLNFKLVRWKKSRLKFEKCSCSGIDSSQQYYILVVSASANANARFRCYSILGSRLWVEMDSLCYSTTRRCQQAGVKCSVQSARSGELCESSATMHGMHRPVWSLDRYAFCAVSKLNDQGSPM